VEARSRIALRARYSSLRGGVVLLTNSAGVTSLFAQLPQQWITEPYNGCVHDEGSGQPFLSNAYNQDGHRLTAHGDLKILVVMVQFPDDVWEPNHPKWPLDGMPVWANPALNGGGTLVVPTGQFPNFTPAPNSLSEFFFDMSQHSGKAGRQPLRVYGDVVHHVYTRTRGQVASAGITPEAATCEILNTIDLPNPPANARGFARYDTWHSTGRYQHVNAPDVNPRMIDMVVICWRNIDRDVLVDEWPWKGAPPAGSPPEARSLSQLDWQWPTRAHVVWNGALTQCDVEVVNGVPIVADFDFTWNPANRGASIWFRNFLESENAPVTRYSGVPDQSFRGLVHEFAHHLISGGHWKEGPWHLISNSEQRGYMPSAVEMAQLGWTMPKHIIRRNGQTNNLQVELGDLYTTGDFVQIEISEAQNDWYFLENHQMLSKWDNLVTDSRTTQQGRISHKGLYVLHGNGNTLEMGLISSTGATTWPVARNELHWGRYRPVFATSTLRVPDANQGYTKSQHVWLDDADRVLNVPSHEQTPRRNPIYLVDVNGIAVDSGYYQGGGAPEMFTDECGKRLWTVGTNPGSHYSFRGVSGTTGSQFVATSTQPTDASFIVLGTQPNGTMNLRLDQGPSVLPNIDARSQHLSIDDGTPLAHGSSVEVTAGTLSDDLGVDVSVSVNLSWPFIPGVDSYDVTFGSATLASGVTSVPLAVTFTVPVSHYWNQEMLRITPTHAGGTLVGCPLEVYMNVTRLWDPVVILPPFPPPAQKSANDGFGIYTRLPRTSPVAMTLHGGQSVIHAELRGAHTSILGVRVNDVNGRQLSIGNPILHATGTTTRASVPLREAVVGLVTVVIETSLGTASGTMILEAP
jgi:hypothetical protein